MKAADVKRALNRALVQDLFNGFPPYTVEEEKANNILVNVNWKQGTSLLHDANRQYENAFLKPGNRFTVTLPDAPTIKREAWGNWITRRINKTIKGRMQYHRLLESKFASVNLHGPGAQLWEDQDKWLGYFVPIEDLLIPTDTTTALDNMPYFAVRRPMLPGTLYRKTLAKGKNCDPGWNQKFVTKLLSEAKLDDTQTNNLNWAEHPEKLAELMRQNLMFYDSDKANTIWLWDFYHQEEDVAAPGWHMKIMLDQDCGSSRTQMVDEPMRFLYESKQPVASDLSEILHIQFGDGNVKPPFLYHSVRSLGTLLFDVVHMMNRLRCQFTQKVFEDMLLLFRANDPADRSRLDQVYMGVRYGILPEGLSFVPRDQRYSPDANLVEMLQSDYRQLMSEHTSAYTQDVDTGTKKERTAFEVHALISQVGSLMASMLNRAYSQESFADREICRRFCRPNTHDFDCKKFQEDAKAEGIPRKWLDVERWDIEPDRVLGGGNKALEIAQAQQLMATRNLHPPQSQQKILYLHDLAVTDDAKLAYDLAKPDALPEVTPAIHDAEESFGTLMLGVNVEPMPGVNHIEQITTFLRLMAQKIGLINQTGGVGTPQDIIGLQAVARRIVMQVQLLSEDRNEKQRVTVFKKALGKLLNQVKAFAQRQQQAAQKQGNGADPETIARIQGQIASDAVKTRGKEQANQQKLRHKQQAFVMEQQRKNLETVADIQRNRLMGDKPGL